jgi:hypothetical protein
MSLNANALGDLIKSHIDGTTVAERRALFRAFGNAIVQHIAENGIAAAGSGSDMSLWMTQVGSFVGAAPTFSSTAIAQAIPPTYSTVTATCTGTAGTFLPQGRVVQVQSSPERFESTLPATIGGSGHVDVLFQAQSSGAVLASANSLNAIITAVDGWTSITNSSPAAPGVDPVALNGNTLGDLIKANIDAVVNKQDRQAVFRAIGSAIVTHISNVGIAAAPLMATWQGQVETTINSIAPGSIAPLSPTFDLIAIVK